MKAKRISMVCFGLFFTLLLLMIASSADASAIFTALGDGTGVNINLYEDKCDVFLNGGPPANAPCTSGGLDDGCYVFQVTAPPGGGQNETLLSQDSIKKRFIKVSGGVFVHDDGTCEAAAANLMDCFTPAVEYDDCGDICDTCFVNNTGSGEKGHDAGIGKCASSISDNISVRLMPYDETPNPGGVYKVYATRVEDYTCKVEDCTCSESVFGFIHDKSKTDNFRVKPSVPPWPEQGEIVVLKFCDANANGILDPAELAFGLSGWQINFDPDPKSCSGLTDENGLLDCPNLPKDITYSVSEEVKDNFTHTATCVDGPCGYCSVTQTTLCNINENCPLGETCIPNGPATASITITGDDRHNVDFGNVGLSTIKGRKFSDLDASASFTNPPDTGLPGVRVLLSGTAANGTSVNQCAITGSDGSYSFSSLLPGTYTVTEDTPPAGSIATTPTSCNITLTPDLTRYCSVTTTKSCTSDADCPLLGETHETCGAPTCAGTNGKCDIGNVCKGAGGGLTLGFWSNSNGLTAIKKGPGGLSGTLTFLGTTLNLRDALGSPQPNGSNFDPTCFCYSGACPAGVPADCTTGQKPFSFRTWLLNANATSMAYMLSAQLAAMELNVREGFVSNSAFVFAGTAPASCTVPGLLGNGFISIQNLMDAANSLSNHSLLIDALTNVSGAARSCQEFMKNALYAATNNQNFAVPCASPNATCP
jgi:hypothetical protein